MALVTLRVLDGADRGRIFENLSTPVTIGREEGNLVQLNDERISRFHLKIQEDDGHLVMTDLESTNGTKVNGESVQLWILRYGDVIYVGRTVLLFGSQEEVTRRLASLRGADLSAGVTLEPDEASESLSPILAPELEFHWGSEADVQSALHTLMPPDLPSDLTPGQAAQLSELFQYFHLRMRSLVQGAKGPGRDDRVVLEQREWQNLLDLHDRIACYLRAVGEPEP
jgi:pSer/pThr/pTyr-binding forkhead associated (FHA) protein